MEYGGYIWLDVSCVRFLVHTTAHAAANGQLSTHAQRVTVVNFVSLCVSLADFGDWVIFTLKCKAIKFNDTLFSLKSCNSALRMEKKSQGIIIILLYSWPSHTLLAVNMHAQKFIALRVSTHFIVLFMLIK